MVKKVAPKKAAAKTTKSTASKKPAGKAAASAKKASSISTALKPCNKKFTATELLANACEAAGIERKQGKAFMEYQTRVIAASIMKGGVGSIKMLGWNFKGVPVPAKKMPAIKKGTMVKNPFNGGKEEPHKGRAAFTKPATMRVKAMALKAIKDMISGAK